MKIARISYRLIVMVFCCLFLSSCATAPITGRSQLLLVSEADEIALGMKAFQDATGKAKKSTDARINAMVARAGYRIAAQTDKTNYQWQFTVLDDPKTVNAFALPGGKVAVYTGILPYTRDENGLAFVLAHEVGHVLAHHGNERMSQQMLIQLGQQGLNLAIANKSAAAIQAINLGYGLGASVGVALPFSRAQEYEADHIGIILMAKAGYDPREAPKFFERMLSVPGNKKSIEFLSTHPADANRIRDLKGLIPEALTYYRPK